MIDFRKIIRESLLDNFEISEFLSKVGDVPNISYNIATNAKYPMIVYSEINTSELLSSGINTPEVYETRWQVAVFSENGQNYKVKQAIDNQMRKIGFTLYRTADFVEEKTKIQHTYLGYSQVISTETFKSLENNIDIWINKEN